MLSPNRLLEFIKPLLKEYISREYQDLQEFWEPEGTFDIRDIDVNLFKIMDISTTRKHSIFPEDDGTFPRMIELVHDDIIELGFYVVYAAKSKGEPAKLLRIEPEYW